MQAKNPPREFIAKVDPFNSNERELFRDHDAVPFIQVKYSDSHWLLDNPVEDLLGPDQQLILVDWEDGEKLDGRKPDDIVRRCIELEEYIDYAYLGDRWTYETLNPRKNRKQINWSIGVQRILRKRFEEFGVDFEYHPMVLGWKRWHLERHRDLLEEFDTGLVGFDATGYRSKYKFAADVNRTIETLDLDKLYVSGRMGPTYMPYMPSEVKAFSGKGELFNEVRLPNGELSRDLLTQSIRRRIEAFNSPQTDLRQFTKATS